MKPETSPPKTGRRNFLKGAAASAAGVAAAATTGKAAEPEGSNHKKQYGMLIDLRRCVGCHACSVACKAEFDVPLGQTRSWVEYIEKGTYPNVKRNFLPRLCNHCSEPLCVTVCPTGATWKRPEDGIVQIDPEICIGCKYCIQACPYGMRFLNPVTGSADKCDFCLHRVEQGLAPSCVNTCMAGARIFGDLSDPDSQISRMVASNAVTVLRPEMGTKPNVYYIEADHTDPATTDLHGGYVRIETNRRQQERV